MDDTSLSDDSESGHTVGRNGNAQRSSGASKFGGYSVYLDGNADFLSIPNSSDFDFGADDFTIDFWFRPNSQRDNLQLFAVDNINANNYMNGGIRASWGSPTILYVSVY